ncbi:hypothetical protein ATCC90586_010686 [Pythium insidiosum]|nr:hypothetical protein ATCC90586_010686 [Pythium insidiosum]
MVDPHRSQPLKREPQLVVAQANALVIVRHRRLLGPRDGGRRKELLAFDRKRQYRYSEALKLIEQDRVLILPCGTSIRHPTSRRALPLLQVSPQIRNVLAAPQKVGRSGAPGRLDAQQLIDDLAQSWRPTRR